MLESFFSSAFLATGSHQLWPKGRVFASVWLWIWLHILGYSKSRKGEFTQMLMSSFLCIPNMFGSSQTSAVQSFYYSVLTERFASYSRSYKFVILWSDLLFLSLGGAVVVITQYCNHYWDCKFSMNIAVFVLDLKVIFSLVSFYCCLQRSHSNVSIFNDKRNVPCQLWNPKIRGEKLNCTFPNEITRTASLPLPFLPVLLL